MDRFGHIVWGIKRLIMQRDTPIIGKIANLFAKTFHVEKLEFFKNFQISFDLSTTLLINQQKLRSAVSILRSVRKFQNIGFLEFSRNAGQIAEIQFLFENYENF